MHTTIFDDAVTYGKLECTYVIARIESHFSICCGAESPANMQDLPLSKFEDRFEASPTKDPTIAFSGMKVSQVEEPGPQVQNPPVTLYKFSFSV